MSDTPSDDLLRSLGSQVSTSETFNTCEKITNLFSNLSNAIHYARQNPLVSESTLEDVIRQGNQHLANITLKNN